MTRSECRTRLTCIFTDPVGMGVPSKEAIPRWPYSAARRKDSSDAQAHSIPARSLSTNDRCRTKRIFRARREAPAAREDTHCAPGPTSSAVSLENRITMSPISSLTAAVLWANFSWRLG